MSLLLITIRFPCEPIYKSYPVYAPGHEPPGYTDWLKRQDPVIVSDDRDHKPALLTEADWIKAGEAVFDAPISYDQVGLAITNGMTPNGITFPSDVLDPNWYPVTGTPTTSDGRLPFYTYVVREKGKVELAQFSCATCHTRVMADGPIIKGAQGNFPFDRARAFNHRKEGYPAETVRGVQRALFAVPSLLGVWYRGPFEHNGSVAKLEDWFDPRRRGDDYVPTGRARRERRLAR